MYSRKALKTLNMTSRQLQLLTLTIIIHHSTANNSSSLFTRQDLQSISTLADLLEDGLTDPEWAKTKTWKRVNTKLIYFLTPKRTKPHYEPPSSVFQQHGPENSVSQYPAESRSLLPTASQFYPKVTDKLRAKIDYYHPPINHYYESNTYKTNNYEHKEVKKPQTYHYQPPPVYKPPPIYINVPSPPVYPVQHKEEEKSSLKLKLIGAVFLFSLLALFLQFFLFLLFFQNNNFNITVNVPVTPGRRRRRSVTAGMADQLPPWISEELLDHFNYRLNCAILQFETIYLDDEL